MKILFLGNHNIGVTCLQEIHRRGHDIVAVVGIPEDPHERKYYRSVLDTARGFGIETLAPADINAPPIVDRFRQLSPDLIIVISYRQILRKPIIAIPRFGVINLHGALLPKYRGGSPINWVLINGERETGVTIHYIDEGVDTGPIIRQKVIPISFDDTAVTLFDKVTEAGFEIFKDVLTYFERGDVPTTPNIKEDGSYYRRRSPDQGLIDWEQSAGSIYNLIRALVPPFPGAFSYFYSTKLIIEWGLPIDIKPEYAASGEIFQFQHSGQWAIAAKYGAILPRQVNIGGFGSGSPADLFPEVGIKQGSVLGGP